MSADRIAVTNEGHEGAIEIDRLTGQIVTPVDQRPEWAEGHAVALLAERTGYYEKRIGTLPEHLSSPDNMVYQDLGWLGVDIEGDEVEIEANADYRMNLLGELLGVDTTDAEATIPGQSIELAHEQAANPSHEQTLQEVEGVGFEQKQAVNG